MVRQKLVLFAEIIIIFSIYISCSTVEENGNGGKEEMQEKPIAEVIKDNSQKIMSIEGVVGLYEGKLEDGTPCIKIMVIESSSEIKDQIPATLEGYPVVIEVTGKIEPL
jgi:hypothetical protein